MDRGSIPVSVFDYDDFRKFLGDWLEAARAADPRVSHRWFAQRLGSTNPSALSHIVKNRRPLTEDRVPAFARILGLDATEAEYFAALVAFGQAETAAAADAAFATLTELRTRRSAAGVPDAFAFFGSWAIPAIYEMTRFPNFDEDPAWIAERTDPPISPEEAARALEICERLGFLSRCEGRLRPGDGTVRTPERVKALATWPYHRDGLGHAVRGLHRLYGDVEFQAESAFLGSSFAIPVSRVAEIRKLLYEVQHRIVGMAEQWSDESDRVMHLTLSMVPVARAEPPESEPDA
jgi:uncharacterized protein (TIGR02147 family)